MALGDYKEQGNFNTRKHLLKILSGCSADYAKSANYKDKTFLQNTFQEPKHDPTLWIIFSEKEHIRSTMIVLRPAPKLLLWYCLAGELIKHICFLKPDESAVTHAVSAQKIGQRFRAEKLSLNMWNHLFSFFGLQTLPFYNK